MKVGTLNRHLRRGQELAFKREESLVELVERTLNQAGDAAARNFADQATEHLTAAAPAPTSTMIAVYPDPEQAVALAQAGGEPAEILHVTLAFLGDTDPDQAEAAVAVVRDVAAGMETVEGVVGGIASFGAEPDAEEPLYPSILLPDVPGLAELRQAVCEALDAAGIPYARNHGWTPHMTLAYTSEPSPPSAALMGSPLTFDRLTLARGDVPRDFPLGRSLIAAGPPGWSAPHADEVFDVEALVQMLRTKSDPVRRAAIKAGMTGALEAAGLNFDATNPYVGKVLSGSAAQVTSIAETTRLNVMRTIREAYEEGLSIPDTAEAIRVGMRAASRGRARLIARTELTGVVNGGAVAAASIVGEAAGVSYYKRWLTAPGAEFPRHEEYDDLDGQTVDLDASFDVGGFQLEYPGDPGGPPDEVCNCRCAVVMVESPDAESEGETASAPPAALTSDATDEEANVKRGAATIDPQTLDPQALSALAERARGPAPSIFERRHATREALTAAGVAQPKLVSNYEMTQGGLADRWFIQAAIEAGFSELASDSWPTESDRLTDDKRIVFRDGDHGAVYRLEDGTVVSVSVGYGRCRVMTAGPSGKVGRAAIGAFRSIYPASYLVTEGDNRVPITFWMNTQFGPRSRLRRIESSTWEDVEGNYPAAIRDELSSIMAWNDGPDSDGQLLLFQGEPGTGKTWVLRALASQWAPWAEFHYITDPDSFFVKDSSYMVDVLLSDSYDVIDPESGSEFTETDPEGKWRVLILEDTGELLAANAKEAYGQGLSRLLNVVDGMIGQGLRVLAVVTTNDELGDLHPAVKRDGRCAVSLEFGAFSPAEASEWLGEPVEEGGTLAELYARKAGSVEPRELAPGEVLEEGDLTASATAVELGERAPASVPVTLNVTTRGMELDDSDLTELGRFVAELAEFQVEVDDLRRFATDVETPPELAPRDVRPPRGETPTVPDAEPVTKASQVRWEGTLVVEGKITDDGRYIEPGATTWRELPLTLMAQIVTADGHDEARVAGRIDEIWRGQPNPDGSTPIFGRGVFDDSEFGREVARMVEERVLRGNSVDLAVRRFELAYREDFDENGHRKALDDEADPGESDPIDVLFGNNNVIVFTDCVIGASTVCSFPAFADAQISLAASGGFVFTAVRPINWVLTASGAPPEPAVVEPIVVRATQEELEEIEHTAVQPVEPVAASAAGLVPIVPPAEWFANPEFEELTALTVNDEGRVLGHLAEWDTCHIGIPGVCVTPPHSLTNYAYFHLAEVEVEGGDRIACGKITLGTGHAAKHLSRQAAAEHYDHTGAAVADIIVGEDDFGPWVAGALRPDVSAERVRELAGATLSGDWRNVNNNLELVAVLAVNVPGFPVPRVRADIVASGQGLQVMSLTAAGIYDGVPIYEKVASIDQARLAAMRARAFGGLQGLAELARGQAAA